MSDSIQSLSSDEFRSLAIVWQTIRTRRDCAMALIAFATLNAACWISMEHFVFPTKMNTNGSNYIGNQSDKASKSKEYSRSYTRLRSFPGTTRPMKETPMSYLNKWEDLWTSQHIPTDDHSMKSEKVAGNEMESRLRTLTNALSSNTSTGVDNLNLMFEEFPYPRHQNSISIYNEETHSRLIAKLIQAREEDRTFKVVANGGSTTAGGGSTPMYRNERYYARLGNYVNDLLSNIRADGWNQTVQVIGQGHGTRNSLHSAVLFDSFIPPDADLILWEFSINDAAELEEDLIMQNAKLNFLPWIHEVGKMKQPPLVILIYYWDTPYHHDKTTMAIVGRAFQSHGDIARQFDFVAGHINMATYVDELGLSSCWNFSECPFLNDVHHASDLGHLATAFLLLAFLSPRGSLIPEKPTMYLADTEYEWSCGVETVAKRDLKQVITDSASGWKSPAGAWTLDLPALNPLTPRQLVSGSGVKQIENFGRKRLVRQDRQRCTPLGFCGGDAANSFSVEAPFTPIEDVRVMLLAFRFKGPLLESTGINVKLNGSNMTADGRLIPMRVEKEPSIVKKWPCHLSNANTWGTRTDVYWFIFDTVQPSVLSIELCQPPGVKQIAKIQSIVIW